MRREIVLDTETTGISPAHGHRVVEIGAIELDDRLPTGRKFHKYVNPQRPMEAEAERVHGLSDAFLADKPLFDSVADELLDFIADAAVVAHNAAFDRGFINFELERAGRRHVPETQWVCSLKLAQARHPGMYNSLDALCKRYRISLSEREKHGALIDVKLLAAVYFQLQQAEAQALDLAGAGHATGRAGRPAYAPRPRPLASRLTDAEAARHMAFVRDVLKAEALWAA